MVSHKGKRNIKKDRSSRGGGRRNTISNQTDEGQEKRLML